jgi:hypothetical protein
MSQAVKGDGHGDCAYWGLTRPQCIRYHGRIVDYWGRRALSSADEAERLAHKGQRLAVVAVLVIGAAMAVRVWAAI